MQIVSKIRYKQKESYGNRLEIMRNGFLKLEYQIDTFRYILEIEKILHGFATEQLCICVEVSPYLHTIILGTYRKENCIETEAVVL